MKQIDPQSIAPMDNYKLMTNLVMPRPIAWVSSVDASGVVNLAPFSFFNAVAGFPPFVVVSVGALDRAGTKKDTARNAVEAGEFVVNLVTEELLGAMNISAADFPPHESELTAAGLHPAACVKVKPPRVAEAKVSLECKLYQHLLLGSNTLLVGEVVMFHIADELVGERLHIDHFAPVGRMGSPSTYCHTNERFELPRMTYEQWRLKSK